MKPVTVLSFGGGQDSTAILYRLLHDPVARARYAPGELLVLMADTEDEHADTLAHVEKIKTLCAEKGVEFHVVGAEWRRPSWREGGLRGFMKRTSTVVIKAQRKTCTDQLKLTPLYAFLDHWIATRAGLTALAAKRGRGKFAIKRYVETQGKIQVLIGIARGEEKRVAKADAPGIPAWRRSSIEAIYPLLDWGWDRADCQKAITDFGYEVPPPSNCILCPYMNDVELVWLARFDRPSFDAWVEMEARKLERFAGPCVEKGVNNLGVWGSKTLPEVLEKALAKHGHMTDEQLTDYRMSHGHCVASQY